MSEAPPMVNKTHKMLVIFNSNLYHFRFMKRPIHTKSFVISLLLNILCLEIFRFLINEIENDTSQTSRNNITDDRYIRDITDRDAQFS